MHAVTGLSALRPSIFSRLIARKFRLVTCFLPESFVFLPEKAMFPITQRWKPAVVRLLCIAIAALAATHANAGGVTTGGGLTAGIRVTIRNLTPTAASIRLQGNSERTYILTSIPANAARTFTVVSRTPFAAFTWEAGGVRNMQVQHNGQYVLQAGGNVGRIDDAARLPGPALPPPPPAQPAPPAFMHRIIWQYDGGSFALIAPGIWCEHNPTTGFTKNYREIGRTNTKIELEAIDGSNVKFRLYAGNCSWNTPSTGGWVPRAQGAWLPERRTTWLYSGGRFADLGANRWVETNGGYRREYRETDRCRDYIEVEATDGSGIGFRLYDNSCSWRTPSVPDWTERARGSWNR